MKRRYERRHRRIRAIWAERVAAAGVVCARPDCTFPGGLIQPGQAWDLDHDDSDPTHQRYPGASHASCNRRTVTHLKQQLGQVNAQPPRFDGLPDPDPGNTVDRWSRHWGGPFNPRCPHCRRLGGPCEEAT